MSRNRSGAPAPNAVNPSILRGDNPGGEGTGVGFADFTLVP